MTWKWMLAFLGLIAEACLKLVLGVVAITVAHNVHPNPILPWVLFLGVFSWLYPIWGKLQILLGTNKNDTKDATKFTSVKLKKKKALRVLPKMRQKTKGVKK